MQKSRTLPGFFCARLPEAPARGKAVFASSLRAGSAVKLNQKKERIQRDKNTVSRNPD
jgi:hypothetical protein